jgi:hypothetical protein
MHSGVATATIGNLRWQGLVTLPSPEPTWWFQRTEEASIQVTGLKASSSVNVSGVVVGGQQGIVTGGSLAWPPEGINHTIPAALLLVLGVVDGAVLLGGALMLGRWTARARPRGVESRVRKPDETRSDIASWPNLPISSRASGHEK